ncbi:MAG: hypothetical protein PF795_03050, partial [Kiritimatiellae bacterium]|nr:hypothetical protein [Kiritimatiellia bacterium]
MKTLLPLVCLLLAACGPREPEAPESSPASIAAESSPVRSPVFGDIADQLDMGGVYFSVMDGQYEWETIKPLFTYVQSMAEMARQLDKENKVPARVFDLVDTLPSRLGLDQLRARGSSTVKLPEGGYRSRTVMQTVPNADGLLWRLAGDEIDIAEEIRKLPPTTEFMARFSFDAPVLYRSIRETLSEFPQLEAPLAVADARLVEMGVPVQRLLEGFKRGHTIGVSLNPEFQWVVPGRPEITSPEIGLIAVLSDADGALGNWIIQNLKKASPLPMMEIEVEGQTVHTIGIPAPVSTAVALQFAQVDERLLIASSPLLMQTLLQRREGGGDAPLLAALEGAQDTTASSGWVIGGGMKSFVHEVRRASFQAISKEVGEAGGPMGFMMGRQADVMFALPEVALSRRDGDMSVTTQLHSRPMHPQLGGTQLLMVPAATGMLAGIALPSFQKARTTASAKACTNNLRILDAAKDQWAIENGKKTGDPVTLEDISEYMRTTPVCPDGGVYTLGSLDTDPVCS